MYLFILPVFSTTVFLVLKYAISIYICYCLLWCGVCLATYLTSLMSSVQDGIYAFRKAHMHSTLSLGSFVNVTFEMIPVFIWLMMALSRPFKEGHLVFPLSTPLSSRRSLVWCPWLWARMYCLKLLNTSDLPRSKPLVRTALPASLSARLFPFTPACPGQYTHRSFRKWMLTTDTFQSGVHIPLFTFCSKLANWICEEDGMCCLTVTSWGNPAEGFHFHCQAGGRNLTGCTVFMDGGHTLLDSKFHPHWSLWLSHQCTLWGLTVCCFLEWEAWLCFACWPFSTVLCQVVWQECLKEMLESVWAPFPLLGLLEVCQLACLQYWERERERERERQTDRQTDRQTQTDTDRQRQREIVYPR